ncbi:HalOD1 output domain-containing protein [Halorussus marinus]|uniref:HalOD1 output domain-containing protein n=1 Tax=Halorussus marinus TaxID=2505976 RepID=UPI0010930F5C|nr:HalOD1 output domain-containing protein [Halorussus marinus]
MTNDSNTENSTTYQTTCNPEEESVSEELISAVAALNDAEPAELAVLSNFIDPEALDALFGPRSSGIPRTTDGQVQFKYDSYTVQVETDGTITLHEPESATSEN